MLGILRATPGPPVAEPGQVLRVLTDLLWEGSELLAAATAGEPPTADAVAGYARRRAWVLAAVSADRPELEPDALRAVDAYRAAEGDAAAEAVRISRGAGPTPA